jgi:hypothetical protein
VAKFFFDIIKASQSAFTPVFLVDALVVSNSLAYHLLFIPNCVSD